MINILTLNLGIGGEAVSLAIEYENKDNFAAAGYTEILTNSDYVGGFVRQYGGFSFSRVFEAGHQSTLPRAHLPNLLLLTPIFVASAKLT